MNIPLFISFFQEIRRSLPYDLCVHVRQIHGVKVYLVHTNYSFLLLSHLSEMIWGLTESWF